MSLKLSTLLGKLSGFSFFDSFKHASVYFLGTVLSQGLGIISLPVFTYFLTTEEYGIANVFVSYTLIASVVLSLNLEWSISRYFLEPDAEKKGYLSTIMTAVTVFFIIASFTALFYKEALGRLMNISPNLIIWMLLNTFTNIIWFAYLYIRIVEKKSREMTIAQVLIQYTKFGIGVLGIWYLSRQGHDAYMGKIAGEFFVNAIASVILLIVIRKYFDFTKMRFSHLKYALSYSLPLVPYALGGQILSSFDQWYINSELGHEQAGLYSFAYKIGLLMFGLLVALQNATIVQYTQWMDEKKYDDVKVQAYSIHKLILLAGLFLILFSVDLGTLLSAKKAFREAISLVPIIIGGYVFYGITGLYTRAFNYHKINMYLTVIFLLTASLNVYLNMRFIPVYGYEAAAYTTLACYAVMTILAWLVNDFWLKFPKMPLFKIFISLIPLLAVTVLFYRLGWEKIGMNFGIIGLKIIIMSIFGIGLFYETLKKLLKA